MSLRIAVTGAAGLVGQNLIPRLKARGFTDIVAIDKHPANTAILRRLHPDIRVIEANLAADDGWQEAVAACDVVVVCHAQIGGLDPKAFEENNVVATRRLIEAVAQEPARLSGASQFLGGRVGSASIGTPRARSSRNGSSCSRVCRTCVLRPTLMFGWFDRKHLGWLARFMQRVPDLPDPRQRPLSASAALRRRPLRHHHVVHRQAPERRRLQHLRPGEDRLHRSHARGEEGERCARGDRAHSLRLFWALLWTYGLFDRDPPFTTKQLEALVTPDVFEVIDWPGIFGVKATPLHRALEETFQHPVYSKIVLEF